MSGKHKLLFIIIPAILLIPILLGMAPLNMAHRLANGGPFTHCKQAQWSNHCPFHSLVTHDDPTIVNLDLTPLDHEATPEFEIQAWDLDSTHSNTPTHSFPLRC
jgi:hypothetical protein